MRVPEPPSKEPRRGVASDGYATLRLKRDEAEALKDACAAWMRSHGMRATREQRVVNAERMQRCYRVIAYCEQRMLEMQRESDRIRTIVKGRAGGAGSTTKRKADDVDISRRAHAYRNIGPASRKRMREVAVDRDVEDEDLEEYQSEYRRLFPALDDGRRGIQGLYGPGDFYGDDGGTVEFGSTQAARAAKRG